MGIEHWQLYTSLVEMVLQQLEAMDGCVIEYPLLIERHQTTFNVRFNELGCAFTIAEEITMAVNFFDKNVGLMTSASKQYDYRNPDFRLYDITDDIKEVMTLV